MSPQKRRATLFSCPDCTAKFYGNNLQKAGAGWVVPSHHCGGRITPSEMPSIAKLMARRERDVKSGHLVARMVRLGNCS